MSVLKLHYYLNCHRNENIKTNISIAIDVGSLALGGGAISGGAKGIKLIFAVFDVASSITSLATTAVENKIISQYGSEGQQFISATRTLSAVLGFVDLGGQGVLKLKSMLKDDLITIAKFHPTLANDVDAKDFYQQSKKLIDEVIACDDEIAAAIRGRVQEENHSHYNISRSINSQNLHFIIFIVHSRNSYANPHFSL